MGSREMAFELYKMEMEGDLPTRRGKINKVIKMMVAAGPDLCNDFQVQCQIFDEVGLDGYSLTEDETEFIQSSVSRKLSS